MDLKLLKAVLSLQAESRNNKQQQEIFDEVNRLIPKSCVVTYDSYGNMYIHKGKKDVYPCVVAHVDQVHKIGKSFEVFQADDVLFAFDGSAARQVGVGGDDKCGIYLAIRALRELPACKVVLFKDEEVGCIGSSKCNLEFFSDACFIIQGDRRHTTSDFINYTNGVETTSDAFEKAIAPVIKSFGYKLASGSSTDVGELVRRDVGCCTTNLACGYHMPHTSSEYVVISQLATCEELMFALFAEFGATRWEHIAEKKGWGRKPYGASTWSDWGLPSGNTSHNNHLPASITGCCDLCGSKTTPTDDKSDEYCGSCKLYASDIKWWNAEIARHGA